MNLLKKKLIKVAKMNLMKKYTPHDSESEFEQSDENDENPDLEEGIFVSKNKTVWQKEKLNQKVKTCSQNIITHLPGVKGIECNI